MPHPSRYREMIARGVGVSKPAPGVRQDPADEAAVVLDRCFSAVNLGGVVVDATTPVEARVAIIDRALSGDGGYVCFCNVHVHTTARGDPVVADALRGAWAVLPDGAPVAWLAGRVLRQPVARIAGPDLMVDVFREGSRRGLRHFLYGSTPAVLKDLETRLRLVAPGSLVVGMRAPGFGRDLERQVAEDVVAIAEARPHLVWCALGAPRQELWMREYAARVHPALVLGVGAAFDFVSGHKVRAPQWVQECGLEWLHRLVSEPRRLGRRYVRTNLKFMAYVSTTLAAGWHTPAGDRSAVVRSENDDHAP